MQANHAYVHDDVFAHPEMIISLEEAGLEGCDRDTVYAAQEFDYMDEDTHDCYNGYH